MFFLLSFSCFTLSHRLKSQGFEGSVAKTRIKLTKKTKNEQENHSEIKQHEGKCQFLNIKIGLNNIFFLPKLKA